MKILVTIPHFYEQKHGSYGSLWQPRDIRLTCLLRCIQGLLLLVQDNKKTIQITTKSLVPCHDGIITEMVVVLCAVKEKNLFQDVKLGHQNILFRELDCDPRLLGFNCQRILADNIQGFDYFCYLEDDLVIHDPLFFDKLIWFAGMVGDKNVLLPNRYEAPVASRCTKLYIDGDINPEATSKYQDISVNTTLSGPLFGRPYVFSRPSNPHAGCFFLNRNQMGYWAGQPYFNTIDCSFVGPLESAATLGIMRTFHVYKSSGASVSFFEIEHSANNFSRVFKLT